MTKTLWIFIDGEWVQVGTGPAGPSGGGVSCFGSNGSDTIDRSTLTDYSSILPFDSTRFATNDSDTFEIDDDNGLLLLKQPGFYQLWFKIQDPNIFSGSGTKYTRASFRVKDESETNIYNTMAGAGDDSQMGAVYFGADYYNSGIQPNHTLSSLEMYNFNDSHPEKFPLHVHLFYYTSITDTDSEMMFWSVGGTRMPAIPDLTNNISF